MPVVVKTHGQRSGRPAARDLSKNPMIIYWEMTQACALACRHCRAEAAMQRHPEELDTRESMDLLDQLVAFGEPLPHLILTGGDPLLRPDLYPLIDRANELGLEVSITPAATERLTHDVMRELKAHGIQSLGLSLDGSTPARHEAVRGVPGCYDWTMNGIRLAAEFDLPVQINTLVAAETADDLEAVYELLKTVPVMRWSLFFLIAVGRGRALQEVSPERGEEIMNWVYDIASTAPFAIKTTEAPSYRRVALSHMTAASAPVESIRRTSVYNGLSIRDGHGILFISNTGDIYPAGFLPLRVGNVRRDRVSDIYRDAPVMRALHDPNQFSGKCGRCEYRMVCGGSRARAFAHTGDALASDPLCPYQPVRGTVLRPSDLFLRACRREPVARTPIWLMRQAGRYMAEYRALREKYDLLTLCRTPELACEVTLQPLHRFELDAAILFSDIMIPLRGIGVEFDIREGTGPVIAHPVRSRADAAQLRVLEPATDVPYVLEAIRLVRRELDGKLPLIGFAGAPFTLASYVIEGKGSRELLLTKQFMYREPEAWHTLMDTLATSLGDYLLAQVEAGAQAVQLFDSWVGALSPRDYARYVLPYSKKVFDRLAGVGVPRIHFGTGTATLLELMQQAGGDVIGVDWRVPLDQAWTRLGPVALQGNLDPAVLLTTPGIVEEQARAILAQAAGRLGHIFNLGHGILPNTPLENVERLIQVVHGFELRRTAPRNRGDEVAS